MINKYLAKLAKFVDENLRLMKELTRLDSEFPFLDTNEEERETTIFDWFIFDYKLKALNKTPLDYFIGLNKDIPLEEKKVYEAFRGNIYSLFEVKSLKIGKEMILKDLATEKEYWVWERTATQNLLKGQCLFTRLLPYQNHYIMSGSGRAFHKEATYMLRLGYKRTRENKIDTKISPKQIAEIFSGFQKEENPQQMDLDTLEERLREKLEDVGLPDTTILDVIEKINKDIEPVKIFKEITEKTVFPEDKDASRLLEFLAAFWNKMPHEAMGGISPEQKGKDHPRGFQEAALLEELMAHLRDVIKPDAYPNKEKLNKAIAEAQEKWLDSKNPELDGKSPRELILEERQRLGNPRKEIGIRITALATTRVTKREKEAEELFSEALSLSKRKRYKKAIEKYRQHLEIFPENYIAWGNMGTLYGLLVNKKEAFRCLHKALSINPKYRIAKENLALLENAKTEHLKNMARYGMIKWHENRPFKKRP